MSVEGRWPNDPTRILLVDDEQSILTLLSYPLRQDGYEVVRASSGGEALERFAELEFDLVVLDVMMPAMDGLEVCRRMRASSTVPIIMLTAKTEEIDKVLGLELGADDYITKPFSIREFRSRVKAALRRSAMRPVASGADGDDDHRADRGGRAARRLRQARRADARRGGADDVRRVRDPRRCSRATPVASSAARRCSSGSGATPPTATRARSTSTSAICARSSSTTPRSRSTSSRCAASATASATTTGVRGARR